jgi:osmotically-inducible protein OsmY
MPMRADGDIKRDVEAELRWDVDVQVTEVCVQVTNGMVTLSGQVPSVFQKHEAARAARFVSGVTAIANDIVVRSMPSQPRPVAEGASDAFLSRRR